MCKPIREGGQRCASHTRRAFAKAAQDLEWIQANSPFAAVEDARQERWDRAAIAYASTTEGAEAIGTMRDEAARAGDVHREAHLANLLKRGADLRQVNTEAAARLRYAARTLGDVVHRRSARLRTDKEIEAIKQRALAERYDAALSAFSTF